HQEGQIREKIHGSDLHDIGLIGDDSLDDSEYCTAPRAELLVQDAVERVLDRLTIELGAIVKLNALFQLEDPGAVIVVDLPISREQGASREILVIDGERLKHRQDGVAEGAGTDRRIEAVRLRAVGEAKGTFD